MDISAHGSAHSFALPIRKVLYEIISTSKIPHFLPYNFVKSAANRNDK